MLCSVSLVSLSSKEWLVFFFSNCDFFFNISIKFWKPIGSWMLIRHPNWDFFAPVNSSVQGVVSPHHRSPVAYNCCVSVFQACNARIEPTTLKLIDETCTSRFSSTSATGWLMMNLVALFFIPWVAAPAVRWSGILKSCDLQPALQCAIRGAQGVLPCVGWGVRPVNWIYRLWRHCL